ncbi:hypothetical protein BsWGS_01519 [Bradybaena similaris]
MADQESSTSVNDIEEQIRKLVEEKGELERRNREKQQQEQRLRLLKDSLSTQRANYSSSSRESNRDRDDISDNLNASLAPMRSLQQSSLNISRDGALDDSRDDSQRSSDDADDDIMLPEHKEALRSNRDILVENMTADDIFNDLISKHILTNTDVSRIKEKNTTEAINEELLNVLMRRSDRAFHVFVAALKRTLQGWLANRIDPASQQKNKRKRRTGEIDVNLNCEQIVPANKKRHTCTCREVEEQILTMAKGAFSLIRRRDASASAFEQFKKELKQTNEAITETMETVNALKILCRHGEITDMTAGSVCFTICCSSLASCQALWEAYESGTLLQAFQQQLVTPALLRVCNAKQIYLCVRVSRLDYLTCALELASKEMRDLQVGLLKPVRTKNLRKKAECIVQDENRSGNFTKVFLRTAGEFLKEIPVNTIQPSCLTSSKRFVSGCDMGDSNAHESHIYLEQHNLSSRDAGGYCTAATKPLMQKHIWLRSHEKQFLSHKCMFNHILLQNDSLGHCKFNGQLARDNKDSQKVRKNGCPYNLRCRLSNDEV